MSFDPDLAEFVELQEENHALRALLKRYQDQEMGAAFDCARHETLAVEAERAAVARWLRKGDPSWMADGNGWAEAFAALIMDGDHVR